MTKLFFKNVLCIIILMVTAQAGNGQTSANSPMDARITEVYGSYLPQLNKDQLSWIHNQLERSVVKKMPAAGKETYALLSSLRLVTKYNPGVTRDEPSIAPLSINPLKYEINFHSKQDQFFRIDGTDYVLLIKAQQ